MKKFKKGPFVVESFITIGSFDYDCTLHLWKVMEKDFFCRYILLFEIHTDSKFFILLWYYHN
jgi:hypothetical protein